MAQAYLGNTELNQTWLGNTQIKNTVSYYNTPNVIIKGAAGTTPTQASFEAVTTGENITSFYTIDNDLYATSTSSFSINTNAYDSALPYITYVSSPMITSLGNSAFEFGGLIETVDLPNCTILNDNALAFQYSITNLNIPNVVIIGPGAFRQASPPENPTIQLSSISFLYATTVGVNAFTNWSNLTSINLPALSGSGALGGNPDNNNVFTGVPNSGSITVPGFYATNNAGAPDGDIQYLIGKSWSVTYL